MTGLGASANLEPHPHDCIVFCPTTHDRLSIAGIATVTTSLPAAPPGSPDLTLDNCADEPIHLPGQIQPHGSLLVFDSDARLIGWAANAETLLHLPMAPAANVTLDQVAPSAEVMRLVLECRDDMAEGETVPMMIETSLGGQLFDCIAHGYRHQVLVEFELRQQQTDTIVSQVMRGQRSYDRLKRQKTVDSLLQLAVEQVRAMTGFDRVMAYRFRHDDSGEVIAEARLDTLVPYLGQRYPASDIPAQARRLYTINTLRLIPDVAYRPVPVLGAPSAAPIDMSHSVLRSVSPVHVEYLQNMGVGASMSVSILVNGRLWGMLACHHMQPKQVPYAIRLSCDVLAQVLASSAQGLESTACAALLNRAARVRSAFLDTLLEEDDLAKAVAQHADALCTVFGAGAVVLAQHGKLQCHGDVPAELASAIVASLPQHSNKIVQRSGSEDWPEELRDALGKWVGLLGLSFNPAGNGWLLILRVEQIESVRWGGKPEKTLKSGPLGLRLTPRGSFDAWVETTRGRSEPWDTISLDTATLMLAELHRFNLFRQVETDRIRTLLLAMLGHDLRDPLHSIQMAATLLRRDDRQHKLGRRIEASGARMQRLIGQVLDMSQLHGGAAVVLNITSVDLVALIVDLVDESRMAHPGVAHELDLPPQCMVEADADRMAQVFTNLIGNALHHGAAMRPIKVSLQTSAKGITVSVQNESQPIGIASAHAMFDPFKVTGMNNIRNPGGMGLGLYIVREIVAAHHGSVRYRYAAPNVIFDVELPASPEPTATPHEGTLFKRE
jgi:chemotaxis family two-component system sensor kinase Cph1